MACNKHYNDNCHNSHGLIFGTAFGNISHESDKGANKYKHG